ncbi:RNA polymerase sigma factor [Caulifigura coniformis]|uniref:RNA polymerase sigma factor n=1 Tax=Caulifigura coniformis TaxID=2527983 RepID=A0A517SLK9_9PLAN|nr:ECF-type sigma factor [Caulifigura coniformis]QDT57007.1 RNA polymerase sigma factor [Caulifigura coniformis]
MIEETDPFENWIERLQDGDPAAAEAVWNRFSAKLLRMVQLRLRTRRPRHADEEDVVNSAMKSLCRRAEEGQFQHVRDGIDLWKLLVTITQRKAINLLRDAGRKKRGSRSVRGDSALRWVEGDGGGFDTLPSPEPTPEFAAMMFESTESLLQLLDGEARLIAELKLQGHTNSEVAQRIGKSLPTVERRLKLIRTIWDGWSRGDSNGFGERS